MFVSSDPPQFRKARALAVSINNHEATFLNHTSYVDTTKLQTIPGHLIDAALIDPDRNHGPLAPFLCTRIIAGVSAHDVMMLDERSAVVDD